MIRKLEFWLSAVVVVVSLIFLAQPLPARAEEGAGWVNLSMENGMGGHVYLTHEPCDVSLNSPTSDTLYRAYSLWNEGQPGQQQFEACWFTPYVDLRQFPTDSDDRLVRFVYVLTPDGRIYKSLFSDYVPAGQVAAQERKY
jgi:hypothetical protein